MAGRQYLNQISAEVRDNAVGTLQALLRTKDASDEGRYQEALEAAARDVVGRSDREFQLNAVAAALTYIVAGQQEQIDALKRTKANASSLKEAKQK